MELDHVLNNYADYDAETTRLFPELLYDERYKNLLLLPQTPQIIEEEQVEEEQEPEPSSSVQEDWVSDVDLENTIAGQVFWVYNDYTKAVKYTVVLTNSVEKSIEIITKLLYVNPLGNMARIEVNELSDIDSSLEISTTPRNINANRSFITSQLPYVYANKLYATRDIGTQTHLHVLDTVRPVQSHNGYPIWDMSYSTMGRNFGNPISLYYYESSIEYLNNIGTMCQQGPVVYSRKMPTLMRDAVAETVRPISTDTEVRHYEAPSNTRYNMYDSVPQYTEYYSSENVPYYVYQQQNFTTEVNVPIFTPSMGAAPTHVSGCYNYFGQQNYYAQYPYAPPVAARAPVPSPAAVPLPTPIPTPQLLASSQSRGYYGHGDSLQHVPSPESAMKHGLINLSDVGAHIAEQMSRVTLSSSSTSLDSSSSSESFKTGVFEPRAIRKKTDSDYNISYCSFCQKNGETRDTYMSHKLREGGNSSAVECPVLRAYVCTLCGATGDNAHTKSHCPKNASRVSTTHLLMQTTYKSNGRIRD